MNLEALNGVAVLVIEDDPDTLELFSASLGKLGAEVRIASTVEAGLEELARWRPDAVLCDLHLPGMDGYSLMERVLADARLRDIPVIAISGSHPEIERERSLEAGFAEHLTKPSKLRDIVAAVTTALTAH